ncbi:hypothetical protein ACVPPR_07335 [Dellaglioa sp. L3N]
MNSKYNRHLSAITDYITSRDDLLGKQQNYKVEILSSTPYNSTPVLIANVDINTLLVKRTIDTNNPFVINELNMLFNGMNGILAEEFLKVEK